MAKHHRKPTEFSGSASQLLEQENADKAKQKLPDDFASVARRLECDPDLKKFDAQLRKIAKAKPKASRP